MSYIFFLILSCSYSQDNILEIVLSELSPIQSNPIYLYSSIIKLIRSGLRSWRMGRAPIKSQPNDDGLFGRDCLLRLWSCPFVENMSKESVNFTLLNYSKIMAIVSFNSHLTLRPGSSIWSWTNHTWKQTALYTKYPRLTLLIHFWSLILSPILSLLPLL